MVAINTSRGLFAATLALLLGAAVPASAAEIKALRVWAGPEYTRVVFDVSGPLDYKLFDLANPDRIVLDLRDSTLASDFTTPVVKGLLKDIRSGKQGKNDARIVFDLGADVRPKSFLLQPADKFGYRLVLDLYPKTAPVVAKTVSEVVPGNGRNVVIAIDPGHGGDDPGSIGASGTHEKVITLEVARELKRQIDRERGMSAFLTRDGDYFIPLKDRHRKAREAKADLFVSVHADAFTAASARGSSVWVLSPRGATSEAARWLAARENGADLVGGVSLDDKDDTLAAVLLDLSQGATMEASNAVARDVLGALRNIGPTHRGYVERANFVVLRSPDVPSILVETAFITNPDEEKRLKDPRERSRIASAVLSGIKNYFSNTPPPGTWYADNAASVRRTAATGSKDAAVIAAAPSAKNTSHKVARGETLSGIAEQYGISATSLREANRLPGYSVRAGSVLRIPAGT